MSVEVQCVGLWECDGGAGGKAGELKEADGHSSFGQCNEELGAEGLWYSVVVQLTRKPDGAVETRQLPGHRPGHRIRNCKSLITFF